MITVTVEQKQGPTTRRMQVSASSIERVLQISGAGRPDTHVRVVFPIDAETFFAPATREGIGYGSMSPEEIEGASEARLLVADDAWKDFLKVQRSSSQVVMQDVEQADRPAAAHSGRERRAKRPSKKRATSCESRSNI